MLGNKYSESRVPVMLTASAKSVSKDLVSFQQFNNLFHKMKSLLSSLLLISIVSQISCEEKDPCRGLEVDLCLTQAIIALKNEPRYTNRTRVEVIESGIDKQCLAFERSGKCFKSYAETCATEEQRDWMHRLRDAAIRVKDEYCTRGSSMRETYVKHGPCLRSVMRDPANQCLVDIQAVSEFVIDHPVVKERLNLACCAYHRVTDCMHKEIRKSCNRETHDFVKKIGKAIGTRIIDIVCRDYEDQRNEVCQMLPAFGSRPKGTQTSSVITKVIRTYTNPRPAEIGRR